ncbi:NAD(+)/NADH kinase [Halocatena pleomorpha]|uniref:ATP-NAD kinase n=1 Tax=Halocatena pleomorpha TaxID=1785090 RepID=A0A3P3RHL2_9EURY|nr:NAD(+)/NADH kinase [Halocatena pleomorpha]RRJ32824.1 hypothetical protein EIK79_03975 [Halocatena pleomorpha]
MTDPRVGIVGDAVEPIVTAVESNGGTPLVDRPTGQNADPAFIIVVEDAALRSLIPDPSVPILPIDIDTPGLSSISRDRLQTELPWLLDLFSSDRNRTDDYPDTDPRQLTVTHPVIGIDRPDGRVYALADVTLVTVESARISEYTVVATHGERRQRIMSVRADGVVIATPAGSHGYAHDAGGPRVAAETGVGVVVPIAPFSIDADQWVVSLSDVRLTVDRNDTAVELRVDGRQVGTVSPAESLRLQSVASIETIDIQRGLERL